MSSSLEEIQQQALSLTAVEREMLANCLMESLKSEPLTEVDQAWLEVAKARDLEIRDKGVGYVTEEELFKELRSKK